MTTDSFTARASRRRHRAWDVLTPPPSNEAMNQQDGDKGKASDQPPPQPIHAHTDDKSQHPTQRNAAAPMRHDVGQEGGAGVSNPTEAAAGDRLNAVENLKSGGDQNQAMSQLEHLWVKENRPASSSRTHRTAQQRHDHRRGGHDPRVAQARS